MGPSLTPLTNLNSGFRVYEVDSAVIESKKFRNLVLNANPRHSKFWTPIRRSIPRFNARFVLTGFFQMEGRRQLLPGTGLANRVRANIFL